MTLTAARAALAPDESVDPLSGVTWVACVSDELTFISVVAELDVPDIRVRLITRVRGITAFSSCSVVGTASPALSLSVFRLRSVRIG